MLSLCKYKYIYIDIQKRLYYRIINNCLQPVVDTTTGSSSVAKVTRQREVTTTLAAVTRHTNTPRRSVVMVILRNARTWTAVADEFLTTPKSTSVAVFTEYISSGIMHAVTEPPTIPTTPSAVMVQP